MKAKRLGRFQFTLIGTFKVKSYLVEKLSNPQNFLKNVIYFIFQGKIPDCSRGGMLQSHHKPNIFSDRMVKDELKIPNQTHHDNSLGDAIQHGRDHTIFTGSLLKGIHEILYTIQHACCCLFNVRMYLGGLRWSNKTTKTGKFSF